jgi:hypothetical protein
MRPETKGWLTLMALTAASTALAVAEPHLGPSALTAGAAVLLALAWAKARVILALYLGLSAAPAWLRGFNFVLGLYCVGLLVLTLAARW